MVAVVIGAIVHAPPGDVELKVTVENWHTCVVPVMDDGNGLTVTLAVAEQPSTV